MKNINDFANEVKGILETKLDNVEIAIQTVRKNNNQILTGLSFRENGTNIAPTIYLDKIFEKCGFAGTYEAADEILAAYDEAKIETGIDLSFFDSFESCKDKIVKVLVNKDSNKELLTTVPSKDFLDLAYIYKILVKESKIGTGSVTITNKILDVWNVCVEDLDAAADANIDDLNPAKVSTLMGVLVDMGCKNLPAELIKDAPFLVATNQSMINGAGAPFEKNNNILSELASSKGCDLYIIPASIHETLIVDATPGLDPDEMRKMIHQVNVTGLAPEEVLSENLYFYDRSKNLVSIVA